MNGSDSKPIISVPSAARLRASGPILILAVLFCVAVFLSWYFTWFGRGLSDSELTKYLNDEKHPRHVQHALLQIQERLERHDPSARQWYPRLLSLAANPETEFRLTAAWVMGSDNQANDFHQALTKLLNDSEPIVRRNAALSLVRFGDPSGRPELLAILEPYAVNAPIDGLVASSLNQGSQITRGTLLVRIKSRDGTLTEVRAPLPGRIEKQLAATGSEVKSGRSLLTLSSDDESIWEALRGLAIVGQAEDLNVVQQYQQAKPDLSDRIREQASLTVSAIQQRSKNGKNGSMEISPFNELLNSDLTVFRTVVVGVRQEAICHVAIPNRQ